MKKQTILIIVGLCAIAIAICFFILPYLVTQNQGLWAYNQYVIELEKYSIEHPEEDLSEGIQWAKVMKFKAQKL